MRHCSLRRQGNGYTVYDAELALVGEHFDAVKDIEFKTLHVEYLGLAEWRYQMGFTSSYSRDPFTVNVCYTHPGSMVLATCDTYTISLEVSASFDLGRHIVKETPYVAFELQQPLPWSNCLELIKRVKDFLTLAAQSPIIVESITAYRNSPHSAHKARGRSNGVKIYFDEIRPADIKTPSALQMLFRLNHLLDDQQRPLPILQRWMGIDDRLQRILGIYFGEFYRPSNYFENRFLNLCHAIEGYHRYLCEIKPERFQGQFEEDSTFREGMYASLVKAIPKTIPTEYEDSVKVRLSYLNEYTLGKRLKQLLSRSRDMLPDGFFRNRGSRQRFVRAVVDLRNDFTHVKKPKAAHSYSPQDLVTYAYRLRLILTAYLLSEAGFHADQIQHMLTRSKLFRDLQYVETNNG